MDQWTVHLELETEAKLSLLDELKHLDPHVQPLPSGGYVIDLTVLTPTFAEATDYVQRRLSAAATLGVGPLRTGVAPDLTQSVSSARVETLRQN